VLQTEREQAAKLVPLIQEAMDEAGCAFGDLGLIVTTVGPGSFTGLRISLSTARSFGASLSIPVQGVSTLEAMAVTCGVDKSALVLLETKRTDYYAQAFNQDGKPQGVPFCANIEEILARGDRFICGDAIERFKREAGDGLKAACHEEPMLNPALLAILGWDKFQQNGGIAPRPEPVYLRGADVSVSNKKQREIKNFPRSV
jgi:tRNA threonylcarbamoyladenosine biosynthesis protein TsaB